MHQQDDVFTGVGCDCSGLNALHLYQLACDRAYKRNTAIRWCKGRATSGFWKVPLLMSPVRYLGLDAPRGPVCTGGSCDCFMLDTLRCHQSAC